MLSRAIAITLLLLDVGVLALRPEGTGSMTEFWRVCAISGLLAAHPLVIRMLLHRGLPRPLAIIPFLAPAGALLITAGVVGSRAIPEPLAATGLAAVLVAVMAMNGFES